MNCAEGMEGGEALHHEAIHYVQSLQLEVYIFTQSEPARQL